MAICFLRNNSLKVLITPAIKETIIDTKKSRHVNNQTFLFNYLRKVFNIRIIVYTATYSRSHLGCFILENTQLTLNFIIKN